MGHKVLCKIGMLICHPVTSRLKNKTPAYELHGGAIYRVGIFFNLRLDLFCLQLVFVAYGNLVWSFDLRLKFGLVFSAYSGKLV